MPWWSIGIGVRMLRALVFKPVSSVFSLSQKLNEVFTVALLIYRVTHLTKTNSILLPSTFLLHINILHKIKKNTKNKTRRKDYQSVLPISNGVITWALLMLLLYRCEITYDFWAKTVCMKWSAPPHNQKRDCEAMTTNICLDVVA